MFCSSCGTGVDEGSSFCGSCGSPTRRAKSKELMDTQQQVANVTQAPANNNEAQGEPKVIQTNGLAIAALVLGVCSALFFEFLFVPVVAIVVSSLALAKSTSLRNDGQIKTGKGFSIAGLVLGGVFLFVWFSWAFLGMGPGR
jgi:hypothetical protein